MEYKPEVLVILKSLNIEKKELTDKLSEIDKLIKRIKYGNLNLGLNKVVKLDNGITDIEVIEQPQVFPMKADLKVQVIKNYITGTTPANFFNSIGKNYLMFRMANKSSFKKNILKNISIIDDGARGFNETFNEAIDFTSQDTKSIRVNWFTKEELIALLN